MQHPLSFLLLLFSSFIVAPIHAQTVERTAIKTELNFNNCSIEKQQGYYGLMDGDSVVLPFVYDTLIVEKDKKLIIARNGMFGVLNNRLAYDVPAEFEAINRITYLLNDSQKQHNVPTVFLVKKGGEQGVYKTGVGLIVPCSYFLIYPNVNIWNNTYNHIDTYYTFTDQEAYKEGYFGVCNGDGKKIIPPGEERVYFVRNHSGVPIYAYRKLEKGNQGFNISTGASSAVYDDIIPFANGLIGMTADKWGLLDSNMVMIREFKKYRPLDYYAEMDLEGELGNTIFAKIRYDLLSRNYPLIEVQQQRKNDVYKGLLNGITGKIIAPKYTDFLFLSEAGKRYIWALHAGGDKITIFDWDFTRLNTIRAIEGTAFFQGFVKQNRYVVHAEEKVCLYTGDGRLLAAYTYADLTVIQSSFFTDNYPDSTITYVRTENIDNPFSRYKNSSYGLLDGNGKVIFEPVYDKITIWPEGLIEVRKERKNAVYDAQNQLVLAGTTRITEGNWLDKTNNPVQAVSPELQNKRAMYLIKDETLYRWDGDKVVCMDANYFQFSEKLMVIVLDRNNHYLIDRSGRIIENVLHCTFKRTDFGYCMMRNSKCWIRLDEDGKRIK